MIKAEIIQDSISPSNCRLTTWILEYPRFIHSEILTSRVFSKNAASSRALPIEKMIQSTIDNPAMPVWWGKNQSGMQAKEELSDVKVEKIVPLPTYPEQEFESVYISPKEEAKGIWLQSRDLAITQVKKLNDLGLHKQISNRILEPWFNIRVILSGTEFENFFALRAHPDAQPEFQKLAYLMLDTYNASEPKSLNPGEWHIPFGDQFDDVRLAEVASSIKLSVEEVKIKVAVARCARISYQNYEGKDDYFADVKLCNRLFGNIPRHLSPTEHVAQCLSDNKKIGNFTGWKQYRYLFEDQNLSDPRVIKKQWKRS